MFLVVYHELGGKLELKRAKTVLVHLKPEPTEDCYNCYKTKQPKKNLWSVKWHLPIDEFLFFMTAKKRLK